MNRERPRLIPRLIPGLLFGLAALLAGCSSRSADPNSPATVYENLLETQREIAARNKAARAPAQPPSRALIDKQNVPVIELTIENHDLVGHAFRRFTRQDGYGGRIEVWRSLDNVSFSFRNGVLVGTRGAEWDMLSAGVALRGDGPGPGGGARTYVFRALDNQAVDVAMACRTADLGRQRLVIDDLSHATRHLRETCSNPDGTIVNDYWVADGGAAEEGVIWQSRQWSGPTGGYLFIRRVSRF
ncbi:YjbF family lipoprotein [Chachezhania antarctica]|uniref:YjbF family lipoprotein n=1 Tax=Chachezhania antarctica TaxID=2340860 RepID=UPI000EB03C93|nr:YjbF family lipoprotein [Chachezhania antarctica]